MVKQLDGHSSASQKDVSSAITVTAEARGPAPQSHGTALPLRTPDGTPTPTPPAPPYPTHSPATSTGASSQPVFPAEAPLPAQPSPTPSSVATGAAPAATGPTAAAPATGLPEAPPHPAVGVYELRTLAATSHGSTAYYSAGGWSQFSEDAPELHSPTHGHVPGAAVVTDPAATDGNLAHGRGAGDVGSRAEAAGVPVESQGVGELPGGAGAGSGAGAGAEGAEARGRLAHSPTPSPHVLSAHAQLAAGQGQGQGHVAGHDTQRHDRSPLPALEEDAGLEAGEEQLGDGVGRAGSIMEAAVGAGKGQVEEGHRAVMAVAEGLEASCGVHGGGSGGHPHGAEGCEVAILSAAAPAAHPTTVSPLPSASSSAVVATADGRIEPPREPPSLAEAAQGAAAAAAPGGESLPAPQPVPQAADAASSAGAADDGGVESLEELVSRVCELYLVQARPQQAHQLLLRHCRGQGSDQAALGAALRAKGLPDVEGLGKVGRVSVAAWSTRRQCFTVGCSGLAPWVLEVMCGHGRACSCPLRNHESAAVAQYYVQHAPASSVPGRKTHTGCTPRVCR